MKAIDSILRKDVTLNFSIFALFLSNLNPKEFQISSQVGNSSPQRGERETGGEEGGQNPNLSLPLSSTVPQNPILPVSS